MDFDKINFPIIKQAPNKLWGSEIQGVRPKYIEEWAAGRKIKPYPYKYDTFNTKEDLQDYIEDIVLTKGLDFAWLKANHGSYMPFNIKDDVYYTPVNVLYVTCYSPNENGGIPIGMTIVSLKHGDSICLWVDKIIKKLQDKHIN